MPDSYAKSAQTLTGVWVDTLVVSGQTGSVGGSGGLSEIPIPPAQSRSVSALGGSASLTHTLHTGDGYTNAHGCWGPPVAANPGLQPTPPYYWTGYYFKYTLTVGAPGDSDTKDVWVWFFDRYQAINATPTLPAGDVVTNGTASYEIQCTTSGLTLCRKRTNASYDDRTSPMDFTDQTVTDTWYAAADATVTVSGGGLSATGALAGAGAEVDMGTVFIWAATIVDNFYPSANTSMGGHDSPTCFGVDASLDRNLYKPGTGGEPDSTNYPDWEVDVPTSGAYLKLVPDGGISLQRSASVGYSVGASYTGGCLRSAPVTLNYIGTYADRFEPGGDTPSGLLVYGEPRSWVDGAWVTDTWGCGENYSKSMMLKSELFSYEWQFLDQSGICAVTQASRVAQGEDVGGSDATQNDARCAILCQPLSLGVAGEPHWAGWMALAHLGAVNVNDPSGAATRPSLWTGGTGVTVSAADSDLWTVAAGTSSPTVTRTLASRYPLRMARLAGGYTAGLEYGADWPYILRRNRAGEAYDTFSGNEDDPDWWSTALGGCDEEDVWNWSNYSYLRVGLTAPKAGTVTLTLTVKVPTISDPCYTSAADRWGEFSWSEAERTFTYSIAVAAGANTIQVDLCRPTEAIVPQGEYRLCRVETVQWTLPTAGGTAEAWELTDLQLVVDEENTPIHFWHNKRPWSWRSSDWMYFCAVADGKPALQVHPGFLRMDQEWGLQGIQFRQHDPDSEATDELSYAKASSRLAAELDWQEGFTCTWGDPLSSANNTDADQIAFAPGLYWWDHQHQLQSSQSGCVCTGHLNWVYGAAYDVYYSVFPRGKVCGLSYTGTTRNRTTGTVWVYSAAAADGDYSRVGSVTTDGQGWWKSDALLEKGLYYGFANTDLGATVLASSLQYSGLEVANREYTFAGIIRAVMTAAKKVSMFRHPAGNVPWTAWIDGDGYIKLAETYTGKATLGTAITIDTSGDYDSVDAETDGAIIYVDARNTTTGAIHRWTNDALGTGTWTSHGAIG